MFCPQCGAPVPEAPTPESRAAFCPACGNPLDAGEPVAAAAAEPVPLHVPASARGYAGFWRRALAVVIDSALLGCVTFPLKVIAPIVFFSGADFATLIGTTLGAMAARTVLVWLYFAGFESSAWQATLGKRLLGLRVTDSSGARLRFARASGRFFGKFLSAAPFGLGFLMAAFTARRQALHDLLAGTLVLR